MTPVLVEARDPANELYDQACSLLEAAQRLRAVASASRSAPALAASLGCIEAALEELRGAVPELRDTALTMPAEPDPGPDRSEAAQIRASFALLAGTCRTAARVARPPGGWSGRWWPRTWADRTGAAAALGPAAPRMGPFMHGASPGLPERSASSRSKGAMWDCSGASPRSKTSLSAVRCATSLSPTARTSAPCAEQI